MAEFPKWLCKKKIASDYPEGSFTGAILTAVAGSVALLSRIFVFVIFLHTDVRDVAICGVSINEPGRYVSYKSPPKYENFIPSLVVFCLCFRRRRNSKKSILQRFTRRSSTQEADGIRRSN